MSFNPLSKLIGNSDASRLEKDAPKNRGITSDNHPPGTKFPSWGELLTVGMVNRALAGISQSADHLYVRSRRPIGLPTILSTTNYPTALTAPTIDTISLAETDEFFYFGPTKNDLKLSIRILNADDFTEVLESDGTPITVIDIEDGATNSLFTGQALDVQAVGSTVSIEEPAGVDHPRHGITLDDGVIAAQVGAGISPVGLRIQILASTTNGNGPTNDGWYRVVDFKDDFLMLGEFRDRIRLLTKDMTSGTFDLLTNFRRKLTAAEVAAGDPAYPFLSIITIGDATQDFIESPNDIPLTAGMTVEFFNRNIDDSVVGEGILRSVSHVDQIAFLNNMINPAATGTAQFHSADFVQKATLKLSAAIPAQGDVVVVIGVKGTMDNIGPESLMMGGTTSSELDITGRVEAYATLDGMYDGSFRTGEARGFGKEITVDEGAVTLVGTLVEGVGEPLLLALATKGDSVIGLRIAEVTPGADDWTGAQIDLGGQTSSVGLHVVMSGAGTNAAGLKVSGDGGIGVASIVSSSLASGTFQNTHASGGGLHSYALDGAALEAESAPTSDDRKVVWIKRMGTTTGESTSILKVEDRVGTPATLLDVLAGVPTGDSDDARYVDIPVLHSDLISSSTNHTKASDRTEIDITVAKAMSVKMAASGVMQTALRLLQDGSGWRSLRIPAVGGIDASLGVSETSTIELGVDFEIEARLGKLGIGTHGVTEDSHELAITSSKVTIRTELDVVGGYSGGGLTVDSATGNLLSDKRFVFDGAGENTIAGDLTVDGLLHAAGPLQASGGIKTAARVNYWEAVPMVPIKTIGTTLSFDTAAPPGMKAAATEVGWTAHFLIPAKYQHGTSNVMAPGGQPLTDVAVLENVEIDSYVLSDDTVPAATDQFSFELGRVIKQTDANLALIHEDLGIQVINSYLNTPSLANPVFITSSVGLSYAGTVGATAVQADEIHLGSTVDAIFYDDAIAGYRVVANGETRWIKTFDATSKIAVLDAAWSTPPSESDAVTVGGAQHVVGSYFILKVVYTPDGAATGDVSYGVLSGIRAKWSAEKIYPN